MRAFTVICTPALRPWLVGDLRRSRPPEQLKTADVLARIDPETARKEARPLLMGLLRPSSVDRVQAAVALRRADPESEEALDTLKDCLRHFNYGIRTSAAQSIGSLGPLARDAAPALRRTMRDRSSALVRVHAAAALWRMTGEKDEAVPVLAEVLAQALQGDLARLQAAVKLGDMGPAAKAAVPGLLRLRDDPDVSVRTAVLQALQKIDPKGAP